MMYLGMYSNRWEQLASNDTTDQQPIWNWRLV